MFLQADNDYDKRLLRGKLRVILNEGFKKLYGYNNTNYKDSYWAMLSSIMHFYSEEMKRQFDQLSSLLHKHSKSSSWWKEERMLETHITDADKLYLSRQEKLVESRVITESLKLFETLQAVNEFLTNAHGCLYNHLVGMYRRGEIKE